MKRLAPCPPRPPLLDGTPSRLRGNRRSCNTSRRCRRPSPAARRRFARTAPDHFLCRPQRQRRVRGDLGGEVAHRRDRSRLAGTRRLTMPQRLGLGAADQAAGEQHVLHGAPAPSGPAAGCRWRPTGSCRACARSACRTSTRASRRADRTSARSRSRRRRRRLRPARSSAWSRARGGRARASSRSSYCSPSSRSRKF